MTVFEFDDYRKLLDAWVKLRPKSGRGVYKNIAEYLRVSPVFISQVLNGDRKLTQDQAFLLSKFMKLTPLEQEFFILLVAADRADHFEYKDFLNQRISDMRSEKNKIRNRILPTEYTLTGEAQYQFFAHLNYTLVLLALTLPGLNQVQKIAAYYGLSESQVQQAVDFLVRNGLAVLEQNTIIAGSRKVHLTKDHPINFIRHLQFRNLAMKNLEKANQDDLFFSAALTLNRKDFFWIKEQILDFVGKVTRRVGESSPELVSALNIDWHSVRSE
jgi:uncharacterized protein (TIGR02147 family)